MQAKEAYDRLVEAGIRPSQQRLAIMDYLLHHPIHPTIDDVYQALTKTYDHLSKTTVYNTLRLFSDRKAALMLTIDDHRVCYDGNVTPHVHFYCRRCGRVIDLFEEPAPSLPHDIIIGGNIVQEEQLYYKGICAECAAKGL